MFLEYRKLFEKEKEKRLEKRMKTKNTEETEKKKQPRTRAIIGESLTRYPLLFSTAVIIY